MPKLVLLDGNHLMHRAYWAIQRNLATAKGEQTNAVFGVASMLLTLLAREEPDRIVVCFDEGKETFRHQEHAAYKAERPETPDDFYIQIPRVRQCFGAFGIPALSQERYEADDLLGSLAKRGEEQGEEVIIVTGDRDLFQMASDRIRIAVPHKGYAMPEYLDGEGVTAKLGVTPAQVPDYKGLTGDPSDNLRGVRGIGPKTAVSLLRTYGSLEGIYEHLPEVRPGVRSKLIADAESAFLCRKLATIVTDVPVTLPYDELWRADQGAIDRFFGELEFLTLRRRFRELLGGSAALRAHVTGVLPATPLRQMTEDQLPLLD